MIQLPLEEANRLRSVRETGTLDELRALVVAYRRAGWTLQAIGTPLEKGRSTVRLWENTYNEETPLPQVPTSPGRKRKERVIKLSANVPAGERERLRTLGEQARLVRRWTEPNAPERRSSDELNATLRMYQDRGVNSAILARHMGVTHRAVRARLERSAA